MNTPHPTHIAVFYFASDDQVLSAYWGLAKAIANALEVEVHHTTPKISLINKFVSIALPIPQDKVKDIGDLVEKLAGQLKAQGGLTSYEFKSSPK